MRPNSKRLRLNPKIPLIWLLAGLMAAVSVTPVVVGVGGAVIPVTCPAAPILKAAWAGMPRLLLRLSDEMPSFDWVVR